MLFHIIQTKSGFRASFEIRDENGVAGEAILHNNLVFGGEWEYLEKGELRCRLVYNGARQLQNCKRSFTDREYIPYDILYPDNTLAGYICRKMSERNIFTRYEYYEMRLGNEVRTLYAVGCGKEGWKFPVYRGEHQTALACKECTVYDNLDIYRVMAEGRTEGAIAIPFCLYIDAHMFGNRGEAASRSVSHTVSITTNKKLKAKYNKDFTV